MKIGAITMSQLQQPFLDQTAEEYLKNHPMDYEGMVHLSMVRLEVEAIRRDL
jgi:hypothetical protein